MVKLTVQSARDEDVYKDTVRLTAGDRPSIRAGAIGKVTVNGRSKSFVVRGMGSGQRGTVLMDDVGREALALEIGQEYEFKIRPAGVIGQMRWACAVVDPAGRIAAVLGVWSMVLSVVGVVLGIWSVLPPHR